MFNIRAHKFLTAVLSLCLIPLANASADIQYGPDDVYVRVIDVGQGHSAIAKMPGGQLMVFDAGDYKSSGRKATIEGIKDVAGSIRTIDLLVLSHSDADHLGAVEEIFKNFEVKTVLRGGLERTTQTWKRGTKAINGARNAGLTDVINLKYDRLDFGTKFQFGDATATFVTGYYAPPAAWGFDDPGGSEFRNAGSIVIHLTYAGRSVLFTGDSVGRHIRDPEDALIAGERDMVRNANRIPIQSDVLIAAHHGADNGSAKAFIESVGPTYVIFPAGHNTRYRHPRWDTAKRFLNAGVPIGNIFRTDRGDDDGRDEWSHGRVRGCRDKPGDDDVEIVITKSGEVRVAYREEGNGC